MYTYKKRNIGVSLKWFHSTSYIAFGRFNFVSDIVKLLKLPFVHQVSMFDRYSFKG